MVIGYTDVQLGTETLYIKSVSKVKVPGTAKQKVGGALIRLNTPGRDQQDWQLNMNGVVFDTSTAYATTARTSLEGMDDKEVYDYSDGLISASVIVEELVFNDSDETPLSYEYSLRLIQYQQ